MNINKSQYSVRAECHSMPLDCKPQGYAGLENHSKVSSQLEIANEPLFEFACIHLKQAPSDKAN